MRCELVIPESANETICAFNSVLSLATLDLDGEDQVFASRSVDSPTGFNCDNVELFNVVELHVCILFTAFCILLDFTCHKCLKYFAQLSTFEHFFAAGFYHATLRLV